MLKEDLERFLHEDLGAGDITTAALGIKGDCSVRIRVQEDCVLAGLEEAAAVLRRVGLTVHEECADGDRIRKEKVVLTASGPSSAALAGERLSLNFLMRMSGIATATAKALEDCRRVNADVMVAGTRKTTPGFRRYEKKAIQLGGGDPHRFRLDDAILIKDNHLQLVGSVTKAVQLACSYSLYKVVEVEVTTLEMAKEAVAAGADIIMLDNFSPEGAGIAYRAIKKADPRVKVEISGGITPETAAKYAKAADIISMGALTHSVRSVHFTMDIEPVGKA
jgi:nicotinate-nucleotide pyrophosphorylase (carboxylating)